MSSSAKWITPFTKQCFVTSGVVLNVAGLGLVVGYSTVQLPQLKDPGSNMYVDDSTGSWLASLVGISFIPSNFILPTIMGRWGRKTANLISIIIGIIGWIIIATATDVASLIIARFLSGIAVAMSVTLGPILVGEYASPKYRGALLTTISVCSGLGVLAVHTMGSYLHWKDTAMICALIGFVNFLIVSYSPESPIWLIDKGRYDDSRRVFRWLRGSDDEDELKKMIENHIVSRKSNADVNSSLSFMSKMENSVLYWRKTITKKEFFKPIVIMLHLYTLGSWSGINPLATYAVDIIETIVGDNNVSVILISIGLQRLFSSILCVYIMKKFNRRTILVIACGTNLLVLLVISAYAYAKAHDMLPFDSPFIGIILLHVHMFSISTGSQNLQFVLAGELFPQEFRHVASAITCLSLTPNLFITIKTVPFLFTTMGLHGAYLLYAGVFGYCMIVICIMLPETKDRTLLDIESEFKTISSSEELKTVEPLNSLRLPE